MVRSLTGQAASASINVTVSKYAPAVFMDAQGPALYHADGTRDRNKNFLRGYRFDGDGSQELYGHAFLMPEFGDNWRKRVRGLALPIPERIGLE